MTVPLPYSLGSRFAMRIRRRYPQELLLLPAGLPDAASMRQCYEALRASHDELASLRITRNLVLERLVVKDCDEAASLDQVCTVMSELAQWSLAVALEQVHHLCLAAHGQPYSESGQISSLWVLGMGKLGARELNVSSDIDLVFVYSDEGRTSGLAGQPHTRISNSDYFQKLVRQLCQRIADVSEHGFVFRVDLALRPHGGAGPTALSLPALEEYFCVSGREWERFAWLKSRVVASTTDLTQGLALKEVVGRFVYRKYLDYSVFESLRQLHRQIRDHTSQRAAGRPDRVDDVKLSRGGIRELEFIVQLLQVVRGGQFPELCTRATLTALRRLVDAALMPQASAAALEDACIFLRRVEHRIQYLDDQQTHVLPTQAQDLAWLAACMGFANSADFTSALNAKRELVANEFDRLLGQSPAPVAPAKPLPAVGDMRLAGHGPQRALPPTIQARVEQWTSNPKISHLRDSSRQRLSRLVDAVALGCETGHYSEVAALRFIDWVEPLVRREAYLALLVERPLVLERLLRVLGAARWPQRYLMHNPGVIDELASHSILSERFSCAQFEEELHRRQLALDRSGHGDEEGLMALLRRAQHAEMFRVLVRDVERRTSVEQVADELSAIADAILRTAVTWAWRFVKEAHVASPRIALIGYGKLGAKELGYGSDLDIVCLYDDPAPQATVVYARLVRKLISWLSTRTADGELYDIDTALRPNGSAGLLVTSMQAFEDYQIQRGSNAAWTWEHQAMTRARCVVADGSLAQRFDEIRRRVLTSERDKAALQTQIMSMRDRVFEAHRPPPHCFDIKHGRGGMIDVEFAVQHLILAEAARVPALTANIGTIALLREAEAAGLLAEGLGERAAQAYRALRRAQHAARLNEEKPILAPDQLADERRTVAELWQQVFGQSPAHAGGADPVRPSSRR